MGATKREEKGGGGKSFSHAKGGGVETISFKVVLSQELKVLAILKEGAKRFHPL